MARCAHTSLSALLCVLGTLSIVHGQKDCTGCYQMDGIAITAIVVGDIIITVLIALAVFFLARKLSLKKINDGNMKSQKAGTETEPHYQELQGRKLDIYSDLNQIHK
ncbi:TYRO protein tyrosine kinase-binding protein [Rhinatrema bivittatum]|uniref:TYRO protein tyrosine kinase-binding protein n=1 Tax=Rhinatrema bivittatum TaxID=194408 RepID=UPI00112D5561|nr:TYRO protein tyrosine kinase-binding protein [Rhinatrema bivittatum]